MNDFELVKFELTEGGVRCDYRLTQEIDGVPYENKYSVNDTRQVHGDLSKAVEDCNVFLGEYLGKPARFVSVKFSGKDDSKGAIVAASMETALGSTRVKLPKVHIMTDDRKFAVDLSVCCERLQAEVEKFLFDNKVGELTPIEDL